MAPNEAERRVQEVRAAYLQHFRARDLGASGVALQEAERLYAETERAYGVAAARWVDAAGYAMAHDDFERMETDDAGRAGATSG